MSSHIVIRTGAIHGRSIGVVGSRNPIVRFVPAQTFVEVLVFEREPFLSHRRVVRRCDPSNSFLPHHTVVTDLEV